MNNSTHANSIRDIAAAIENHPGARIKGVALASLIRKAAPGLNIRSVVNVPVGPGALTKFADTELSAFLRRIERAQLPPDESDVVYEKIQTSLELEGAKISEPETSTHLLPVASQLGSTDVGISEDFWNAFVRPSDARKIVVSEIQGVRHLALVNGNAVGVEKIIGGVTQQEFDAISEKYIETLEAVESTKALASELRKSTSYGRYVEILRAAGGTKFLDWSKYRRERLRELFGARLVALGVPANERGALLSELDQSQASARKKTQQLREQRQLTAKTAQSGLLRIGGEPAFSEGDAKKLLIAAVEGMSMDEMRSLQMTFGAFMDAFLKLQRDE